MMKKLSLVLVFAFSLIFSYRSQAQEQIAPSDLKELTALENDLVLATDSMYYAPIPDTRSDYCAQFVKLLVRTLKIPNSYYYPFTKLGEKINIIAPDDKSFRVFNWNIAPTELTRRYFGAIQMPTEQLKLFPLLDYSNELAKTATDSVLTSDKWFGCLYYNILTTEVNGEKVYTMFGLNAESSVSTKKILDPMVLTPAGPVFGKPIFRVPPEFSRTGVLNRFVIEYKRGVQASMNFDKDMNAIFFDRLISEVNDPNRKYTYVPSGQYDGFRWDVDHWAYVEDLIPVEIRKDGDVPNLQQAAPKK